MAPGNDWLTQVTGEVALARDWPRKAHQLFLKATLLNPENNDAKALMARSKIRIHDYREAEKILHELELKHPIEKSTLQLKKDLYRAKRPDLWADITFSNSQGPEQSGDGVVASTELISSAISDAFRVNAQGIYSWSEIPEGEESLTKFLGGIEYAKDSLEVLGQISTNNSTVNELGGLLRLNWLPDDYWKLSLQGERFAGSTPLRALYYGIRADKIGGSVGYRWHESRSINFNLNSSQFTDSNDRFEAGINFTEKLFDVPLLDIDGTIELYGSKNSREDAPYFNPEQDLSAQAVLKAEHILYRFYDTNISHKLEAGGGIYEQKHYDTGWIAHLRYEQRYSFYQHIEAVLGGELGRNMYDGEPEPYYQINALLHAKF